MRMSYKQGKDVKRKNQRWWIRFWNVKCKSWHR